MSTPTTHTVFADTWRSFSGPTDLGHPLGEPSSGAHQHGRHRISIRSQRHPDSHAGPWWYDGRHHNPDPKPRTLEAGLGRACVPLNAADIDLKFCQTSSIGRQ